jgi:hypothetical protein
MSDLVPVNPTQALATFEEGLRLYLDNLGLPTERVLVALPERAKVIVNVPDIVDAQLTTDQRGYALYLSKFIAAVGAGLFDAALNYLWNETIMNLRQKVTRFDLEYFYDSVITNSDRRAHFKTEDNLSDLDDWELIRGCRETGILSDIGFKHLDYIRDMRNYASAAHPNQNQLTGLQLASWLETCIVEVLAQEPSGPVLEVKKLLRSIREHKLAESDADPIISNIQQLPLDLAKSLLRTVFGMYTDERISADVRGNIDLLAAALWMQVDDEARHEIGLKQARFAANAELVRKRLAEIFLNRVNGLAYLTDEQLALRINEQLDNLWAAHIGWNNFYNEPPHASALAQHIPDSGVVPAMVRANYVRVLVMCRIGNGHGVSNGAVRHYDTLIDRFHDREIVAFVRLLNQPDVISRLQFSSCAVNFISVAKLLYPKTTNVLLQNALKVISETKPTALAQSRSKVAIRQIIEARIL